ncbi:MAG: hypothetical protein N2C14_22280 [Planctomycetales bacterium]
MLVDLDGLAGVDDGSVAGLERGIIVEGFADGLSLFGGGVHAFKGCRETGFQGGLALGSFRDEGGESFIGSGFELSADLTEFGGEPLFGNPSLLETGEFGLDGEDVSVFGARSSVDGDLHGLEVTLGSLDVLFLLRDEFAELFVGNERLRVVRVQSGLELRMFGDELAVGRIVQSELGFKVGVLNFVTFGGITLDGSALGLGHREFFAGLVPTFTLADGLPNADVVDRGAREIELKGEVFANAVNDGTPADDEFLVAQVGNHFVVPVFDGHRLPLVGARFSIGIAKVGGDEASIAIDWRVDLET